LAITGGLDLGIATWLLTTELIAGKDDHPQSLGQIALLQRLEAVVLTGEAATTGGIDHQVGPRRPIGQTGPLAIGGLERHAEEVPDHAEALGCNCSATELMQ
jgi:hypothetical protein